MLTTRRTIQTACLLSLLISIPAQARYDVWADSNGVAVRQGQHVQWDGAVANGENGWLVAWSDAREGELDVYSQFFDASGDPVGQAGGIPVTSGPYGQLDATIVPAQDGGWYVAVNDQREDPEGQGLLVPFLQKLTPDGLPAWAGGPILIEATPDTYDPPVLLPTSDGYLVTMHNNGLTTKIHKFDSNGVQVWPSSGYNHIVAFRPIQAVPNQSGGGFMLSRRWLNDLPALVMLHLREDGSIDFETDVLVADFDEWNQQVKLIGLPDGRAVAIWNTVPNPPETGVLLQGCVIDDEHNLEFIGGDDGLMQGAMGIESLKLALFGDDLILAAYVETAPGSYELRAQRIHLGEEGAELLWDEEGTAS